ncbi:MAG TPA: uracil-DNA glycosylase [Nitrososphaera sp.]|nr:uracil-DNA glycosylase [Nitrososphaera sp.]
MDKRETNSPTGDKKIFVIIDEHTRVAMTDKLRELNSRVTRCVLCPRLSQYIRQVGREKVKRFADEKYWARPLPSWGDPNARLLIVGLAPAAHGGNRTGRMFTGDSSGDWLARAMHATGFANMPTSCSKDDGLTLSDAYITAAVRCAPPDNKPLPSEVLECSQYLLAELRLLKNVKVVLALGKIGFDAYCTAVGLKGLTFGHGARYEINGTILLASYHPSRQNTNTGKLTWPQWIGIFETVKSIIDLEQDFS